MYFFMTNLPMYILSIIFRVTGRFVKLKIERTILQQQVKAKKRTYNFETSKLIATHTARLNWLFSERSSSATFNTAKPSGITVVLQMLNAWKRFSRGVWSVFIPTIPPHMSPSWIKLACHFWKLWDKWTSQFKTFKLLDDLLPTHLLEMIEKRCRTRNLRNSENILKISLMKRVRHGTNPFCFLAPKIWNFLPEALRITRDLKTFRDGLWAYFSL